MPRVKIDYIVSVSSEDPENQANNLLAGEVSKKKWLCQKGEQSSSIVLQLARAVTISAVHIGAHHAAFVEVLVGSSERPNDQYQVLVPRCVFTSPGESRRDVPVDRVRSFSGDQLTVKPNSRWDRIRVLCSQPYNKHCQFGLSFIHIYEPEGISSASTVEPQPVAPALTASGVKNKLLELGTYSSDEDEFRPGELFATHRQSLNQDDANTQNSSNTDAQIRQASSQALKNISDADTKLIKTPIAKTSNKRDNRDRGQTTDRSRDSLMYTDDDEQPHAKIDRVVMRHKEDKNKKEEAHITKNNENIKKDKDKTTNNVQKQTKDESCSKNNARSNNIKTPESSSKTSKHKDDKRTPGSQKDTEKENRKRRRPEDSDSEEGGPVCAEESAVLRGVVFALSGFVHPERGELRDIGLALGARYRPDWTHDCTHLVCAFPNTPKLRKVQSEAPRAHIVSGAWLRECRARRRRLHEARYAPHARHMQRTQHTQHAQHTKHTQSPPQTQLPQPSSHADQQAENDTDDEIEKVLRKQKKRLTSSPAHSDKDVACDERMKGDDSDDEIKKVLREQKKRRTSSPAQSDEDVAFVCDERMKGSVTLDSDYDDTEEECGGDEDDTSLTNLLPDFFDGKTFLIAEDVRRSGFDVELLARYVRAYGGLLLQKESCVEEGVTVDYVVSLGGAGGAGGAAHVQPQWVWRCHRLRALAAAASPAATSPRTAF